MIEWLRSNYINLSITAIGFFIIACSSQEYTTAKLAVQQSDWAKAEAVSYTHLTLPTKA